MSIKNNYEYDPITDLYKKIDTSKETQLNDDTVNFLSFNTINDGLDVINDLTDLYNLFNDSYYLSIKSLAIQKLKSIT